MRTYEHRLPEFSQDRYTPTSFAIALWSTICATR
jgi:hypothetical protein